MNITVRRAANIIAIFFGLTAAAAATLLLAGAR